jgi:hypothetical protein
MIRGDKSRKVGQIEHEENPKEKNSCRYIATEGTINSNELIPTRCSN